MFTKRLSADEIAMIANAVIERSAERNDIIVSRLTEMESDLKLLRQDLESRSAAQSIRTENRNKQCSDLESSIETLTQKIESIDKKTQKNSAFINKMLGAVAIVGAIAGTVVTKLWDWVFDKSQHMT